ncbi:unnamed protein product, partial [Discosporangium mesarthrocarpum]
KRVLKDSPRELRPSAQKAYQAGGLTYAARSVAESGKAVSGKVRDRMATEAYTNVGAPGFLAWITQELEPSWVPESLTLSRLLCTTKGTGKKRNIFVDIPTAAWSKWIK